MRQGEDSASALVRKAGVAWNTCWPKPFLVEHTSGPIRRACGPSGQGKSCRLPSEPTRPDPAFPAPVSPGGLAGRLWGNHQSTLSSDDMPLHQHATFPRSAVRVLAADADLVK